MFIKIIEIVIGILFAYLIGSLSSAIIVCRLFRLPDPRTQGSGNPGATNVLRLGGKKLAALVFLGDFLKGVVPVLLAKGLGLPLQTTGWIGLAAVIGHIFPLFFQFKGGKGVATAAGALLALAWPVGLCAMLAWIIIAALFRYSSLAAVIATLAAPAVNLWLGHSALQWPLIMMSLLVLWRHHGNIRRLLQGTETQIGKRG